MKDRARFLMFDAPGRLREEDFREEYRVNRGVFDVRRVVREEVRIRDCENGEKTETIVLNRSRRSNAVAGAVLRPGFSRFFEPGEIVNRKKRAGTVKCIGALAAVQVSPPEIVPDSIQVNVNGRADSVRQISEGTLSDTLVEDEAVHSDSEDTVIIHTVEDSAVKDNHRSSEYYRVDILTRDGRRTASCPPSEQEKCWRNEYFD